jgi:PAS domain S-box-containing protein
VFDLAPDGMLVATDEGRYIEANPAACRLLGRTRERLLKSSIADISAPGMPTLEAWEEFRREGHSMGYWRVAWPDGVERDLEFTAIAHFLPGLHLALVRDVTERRTSEKELSKKTELLHKIYDHIPVLISMSDPSGRLEWVNREWERFFGLTLEDVQKGDILPSLVSGPALEEAKDYMSERPDRWVDFRTQLLDGRVVDMSWRSMRLSDGTTIFFGQDIGDRKRGERERERRVLQLQQLADMALVIAGAGTIAGIAEAATHAARTILGGCAAETSLDAGAGDDCATRARSVAGVGGPAGSIVPETLEHLVREGQRPMRLSREQMAARPEWGPAMAGRDATPPVGWLAAPLIGRDGRRLGVIQVADKEDGEFGADDEAMLVQIAQLATVAVENARLLREVRDAGGRLQVLSRRLVVLQEEERRTIARELHDEVGQILTGLKIMLETSMRPGATVETQQLQALTEQLLVHVKDLSLNLRPPMLDDLGLVPTLLWHFERYRGQTGIDVRFHHRGLATRLPAGVEIAAFRITQEALTNVARHACVSEVVVELSREDGHVHLRVEDEGKGFDVSSLRRHSSGLTGMRERAMLTGGRLRIESKPGSGTRLLVELPLAITPAEAVPE